MAGTSRAGAASLPLVLLLRPRLALHPLMALARRSRSRPSCWPAEDRRWLLPIVGGAIAVILAAAMLKLPLVDRLFEPMDADVARNPEEPGAVNLFPSLWGMPMCFAHASASRAAAAIVAATFAPPRLRALLLALRSPSASAASR